jgi:uncharacterized protein YcnI
MTRRRFPVLAALVGGLVLLAGPAWAHVTIDPSEAPQGGFATVTFRVPNERDDAATTSVVVEFPPDHPIENASVQPVPGWTATVERSGEAVTRITWTGGPVQPGEFQQFPVSMGPLPDDADELVFPAIQTYDSGEVVRWIEETPPSGEEPEHPAPVLTLTAGGDEDGDSAADDAGDEADDESAAGASSDSGDDDGDSTTLAVVALVVGGLGLLAGVGALVQGRRRTTS